MPVEFAKLTAREVQALARDKTVFFFAAGPLEDHGPHLPMSLDLMQASQLCFSAAERLEREMPEWKGAIMPGAPLGIESNTQKLALTVRPHVLRDWLVDTCFALEKAGFRHFVCFSGHLGPKQLTAIEDAGRIISKRGMFRPRKLRPTLVSASSAFVGMKDLKLSVLFPNPPEHGGQEDTSSALFMRQIADPGLISNLEMKTSPSSVLERGVQRLTGKVEGYWGDPAHASAQDGQQHVLDQLNLVFPKLRAVWEGANPNALFRSWYSILFYNRSFFKAWVLAMAVLAMFIAWYWANFAAIPS
jgi:creatinine amidohydrolase